jgi:hypothetical protein|tara:strand:+ start:2562 stop:2966 length:405 start_codon:yes stop_codon:yes gene_type:complete
MASQRKQKVKKRLKKELLSVRKYKTTYKDIKKFFRLINENVFNGKLSPFNDVNIMDMNRKRCIGQVLILEWERKGTKAFNLEMNKTYRNKKEFVDTLGHEMIHLFQMANLGDTGNHNDIFYSFRPKLNAIGLDI